MVYLKSSQNQGNTLKTDESRVNWAPKSPVETRKRILVDLKIKKNNS